MSNLIERADQNFFRRCKADEQEQQRKGIIRQMRTDLIQLLETKGARIRKPLGVVNPGNLLVATFCRMTPAEASDSKVFVAFVVPSEKIDERKDEKDEREGIKVTISSSTAIPQKSLISVRIEHLPEYLEINRCFFVMMRSADNRIERDGLMEAGSPIGEACYSDLLAYSELINKVLLVNKTPPTSQTTPPKSS